MTESNKCPNCGNLIYPGSYGNIIIGNNNHVIYAGSNSTILILPNPPEKIGLTGTTGSTGPYESEHEVDNDIGAIEDTHASPDIGYTGATEEIRIDSETGSTPVSEEIQINENPVIGLTAVSNGTIIINSGPKFSNTQGLIVVFLDQENGETFKFGDTISTNKIISVRFFVTCLSNTIVKVQLFNDKGDPILDNNKQPIIQTVKGQLGVQFTVELQSNKYILDVV